MATITRRAGAYRVQIRRRGHPAECATFPVRAQAVAWAAAREAEIIGSRHGLIPTRTVRQALERYRDDVSPTHRGARWERVRLDKLARELEFSDRPLAQVAPADVAAWRDAALRRLAPGSVRRAVSAGTAGGRD